MPSVTELNSKHNKFKYRDLLDLNYVETGKRHKAFTEKVAKELIESKEVFCVAFDFAWKWLGYTNRVAAKAGLFPTRNLKPNIDFIIVDISTRTVWIDVENLKKWAVIADTEKSREVLACLDRVEKFALSIVPTPIAPTPPPAISPYPVVETFSLALAKQLIESDDRFPVNFEDAWQWLGYSRKDKGLDMLKSYFILGKDFTFHQQGEWRQGGRSSDYYRLTTNCLKELGMVAKTEQGKQIRKYFLDCEKIAKQSIAPTPPAAPQLPGDIRFVKMIDSLKEINFELVNPRFKQGLQDLAADMLGISTPLLPENARDGVWCGVVERAEQLNYPVELTLNKRNVLGRWVSALISDRVKEVRLCNGTQRQINLYRITPELDTAIVAYFDKINIKPLS